VTLSTHSNAPLRLELRPSRYLTVVLLCSHLGAVACMTAIPVHAAVKIAISLLLLSSMVFAIYRHALLRFGNSIHTILLRENDGTLIRRSGKSDEMEISVDHNVNTGVMIVLTLITESARVRVPIFRDMLDEDGYKRLRVYLKTRNS